MIADGGTPVPQAGRRPSGDARHPVKAGPGKPVAAPWAPLGRAVAAWLRGERHRPLLLHDDYGDTTRLPLGRFAGTSPLPPLERLALRHCRGRVLDLGAGSGRHALALQHRGLAVTAVETDGVLRGVLRERGIRRVRRTVPGAGEHFDTVLLLMNGLGLAGTLSGLPRLLAAVRPLLAPGGVLLADGTDVRAGYPGPRDLRPDGRYVGEMVLQLEYDGERGVPFPYVYPDPGRLRRMARAAGWRVRVLARAPGGAWLAALRPGRDRRHSRPARRERE